MKKTHFWLKVNIHSFAIVSGKQRLSPAVRCLQPRNKSTLHEVFIGAVFGVCLYSHFGGCSLWRFTDTGAFWYNYWLSVSAENIRTVRIYSFALDINEADEILDSASPLELPESHEVESTSLWNSLNKISFSVVHQINWQLRTDYRSLNPFWCCWWKSI